MATTTTTSTAKPANERLKVYADKVSAQIQEAKARLDQFEAKAKEKRAQAQVTAANNLQTMRDHIGKKVQDLKTTHASNVSRAKSDIDEALATFKAKVKEIGA